MSADFSALIFPGNAAANAYKMKMLNTSEGDVDCLEDFCGMFGLACIAFVLVAVVAYVLLGVNILIDDKKKSRHYKRLTSAGNTNTNSRHSADAQVPTLHGNKTVSLAELNHGVTHLSVIMDGNRRFGKKQVVAHSNNNNDDDNNNNNNIKNSSNAAAAPQTADAIHNICHTICTSEEPRSSDWIHSQYTSFYNLIRFTALDGHRRGGEKLLDFIQHCMEARIDMLTVYAFSTDNWNRPQHEVDTLIALFYFFFDRIRVAACEDGMFIRFIATDPELLPAAVLRLMEQVEMETRRVTPRRITVNVCVSYSGQAEVVNACQRVHQRRLQASSTTTDRDGLAAAAAARITRADIEEEMLFSVTQEEHREEDKSVFSQRVPRGPQLLLRTSGEQRLSNFLLYESAYTELAFVAKTWPEVTREDLAKVLTDYSHRDRRMGK